jgi:hypothetical protein
VFEPEFINIELLASPANSLLNVFWKPLAIPNKIVNNIIANATVKPDKRVLSLFLFKL